MKASDPIGVFDSGLGGLSVVASIRKQLPHENLIFFGDSARNPYGTKTKEEVRAYSHEIVADLASRPVKAVVIACNTATSAAARSLRETFDFDIIGMEPALKLAAQMKTPSKIAVWATGLTLKEDKFLTLKERFVDEHDVLAIPCPKLVQLVEQDRLEETAEVDAALDEYLSASGDADFIVLGCTHFLFFKDRLQEKVSGATRIVDGNVGTVRQLRRLLEARGLLNGQSEDGWLELNNSRPEKNAQAARLLARLEDN